METLELRRFVDGPLALGSAGLSASMLNATASADTRSPLTNTRPSDARTAAPASHASNTFASLREMGGLAFEGGDANGRPSRAGGHSDASSDGPIADFAGGSGLAWLFSDPASPREHSVSPAGTGTGAAPASLPALPESKAPSSTTAGSSLEGLAGSEGRRIPISSGRSSFPALGGGGSPAMQLMSTSGGSSLNQTSQDDGRVDVQVLADDLSDWTLIEKGGSTGGKGGVVRDGADVVLTEGDSFAVGIQREIEIPQNGGSLLFSYASLAFDGTDTTGINDAFEVSLVDAQGRSIVEPFRVGRDAFLNATEGETVAKAGDVELTDTTSSGATVSLDISGLSSGAALFSVRLVNNDADTGTSVRFVGVETDPFACYEMIAPAITGVSGNTSQAVDGVITDDNSLTISGTGHPGAMITIHRDDAGFSGVVGYTNADSEGEWSYDMTATPLPRGEYTFNVTQSQWGTLGPASDYSVFVLEDLELTDYDTQGRAAVGRDATLDNFLIGSELPDSHGQRDDLVVGRDVNYDGGVMYGGNIVYGGVNNTANLNLGDNTVLAGERVDFAAAATYLRNKSDQLAEIEPNGSQEIAFNVLTLQGADPELNVFELNGETGLSGFDFIYIDVPEDARALINVTGDGPIVFDGSFAMGQSSTTNINRVLWNFAEATDIAVNEVTIHGAFLAPNAHVELGGATPGEFGNFFGQFIVKSASGYGEIDYFMYEADCADLVSADLNVTVDADLPAKFFVVSNGTDDRIYRRDAYGNAIGDSALHASNTNPKGIASNISGDTQWVVDGSGQVFVYSGDGTHLGNWTANGVSNVRDISVMNVDESTSMAIFVLTDTSVYVYDNAASLRSGSATAAATIALDSSNANPTGLNYLNGFLWVTDDATAGSVHIYETTGGFPPTGRNYYGSYALDAANTDPVGITFSPDGSSSDNRAWVADSDGTVYEYQDARWIWSEFSGADDSFAVSLNSGGAMEGIADPPVVTIDGPSRRQVRAGSPLLLQGTVAASSPAKPVRQVTVNGRPVDAVDAAGNYFLRQAVAEGTTRYVVEARDEDGVSSQTIDVVGTSGPTGSGSAGEIDADNLVDVTAQLRVNYARTSFDPAASTLHADFSVTNIARQANLGLGSPLYMVVKNVRIDGVRSLDIAPVAPDGVLPDGTPYYDITSLLTSGKLDPQATSSAGTLSFLNPNGDQFTYDLVFFSSVNRPPQFVTAPVVDVAKDQTYAYDARALDPDGDALTYTLESGPAGMTFSSVDTDSNGVADTARLTWVAALEGNHTVIVRATDPFGNTTTQRYVLSVGEPASNRPPIFTTDPVVQANVGTSYSYQAGATDPDGDTLTFTLDRVNSEQDIVDLYDSDDFEVTSGGLVTWTPTAAFVGRSLRIALKVDDGQGGVATQVYDLAVFQTAGNRPPVIVSDAPTRHDILRVTNPQITGGEVVTTTNPSLGAVRGQVWLDVNGNGIRDQLTDASEFIQLVTPGSGIPGLEPNDDDSSSSMIDFDFDFEFFTDSNGLPQVFDQFYINNNGNISFVAQVGQFTPDGLNVSEHAMVAPFWADVDTRAGGSDIVRLAKGTNARGHKFVQIDWRGVGYYDTQGDKLNDFTLYIEDDPEGDIVAFVYRDMEWTTGGASGGVDGFDGTGVEIGFSAGNGEDFRRYGYSSVSGQIERDGAAPNTPTMLAPLSNRTIAFRIGPDGDIEPFTEPGVDSFLVQLVNPGTGQVVAEQLTQSLDINADTVLDRYSETGSYRFENVTPGTYTLQVVPQHGWTLTSPADPIVSRTVIVTAGGVAAEHLYDFGFRRDYAYDVEAMDPDGDSPLVYTLLESPPNSTIDAEGRISWFPPSAGTYDFVVKVEDGRGGSDTQAFQLVVGDGTPNVAPEINSTAVVNAVQGRPYAYTVRAIDANRDPVVFSLSGDTDGMTINPTTGQISWTPSAVGTRTFTVIATDSGGLQDEQAVTVTIHPAATNNKPVVTSSPPRTVVVGESLFYQVGVSDPDGDAIAAYSLPTRPVGMAIQGFYGYVIWTPTLSQLGEHEVVLRAMDDRGAFVEQRFMLNVVSSTNASPTITSAPPVGPASPGEPFQHQVVAEDRDGDLLTFSLEQGPDGLVIDPATGLLQWATPAAGTFGVLVRVEDGKGGFDRQSFAINVAATETNDPPVLETLSIPGPAVIGFAYDLQLEASDPNGDSVVFAPVSGLPAWLTLSSSGRLSGTPPIGTTLGELPTITIRLQDARDATSDYTIQLSVAEPAPAPNQPPSITSSPTGPAMVDQQYEYTVAASDADGVPGSLTYAATVDGVAVSMSGNVFSYLPTAAGTYAIVITVTDASGAWARQSFNLEAIAAPEANTPPEITSSPTGPAEVGQPYVYDVVATDVDGGTLVFQLDEPIDGATLTSTGAGTAQFAWTPTVEESVIVRIRVTDSAGAATVQTFTLEAFVAPGSEVQNRPPQITSEPAGVVVVGGNYQYALTATDPDSDAVTFSLINAPVGMELNGQTVTWTPKAVGTYLVQVAATDTAGNSQIQSFNITVLAPQNRPPRITSTPHGPATIGEQYVYQVESADPDGDVVVYSLLTPPSGMAINAQTGRLTWTPAAAQTAVVQIVATDSAGNAVLQRFSLDAVIPGAVNAPPEILSSAIGAASVGRAFEFAILARDPNGDRLTYALTSAPAGMLIDSATGLVTWTSPAAGVHAVRFTVTDDRGASVSGEFDLPVSSNAPPQITSRPTYSVAAGGTYEYTLVATDPNGDNVTFRLEQAPPGMTIVTDGSDKVVTWTPGPMDPDHALVTVVADDGKGGLSSQTFEVRVVPVTANVAPVITSSPRLSIQTGQNYRYQVVAVDENADPLYYRLDSSPAGMTIDDTGVIRWTPAAGATSSGTIALTVSDRPFGSIDALTVAQTFTVAVTSAATNTGPTITSTPPGGAAVGSVYRYGVEATDPDGDPVSFVLLAGPAGMTIDELSGAITWRPTEEQLGNAAVRVAATDSLGAGTVQAFTLVVRGANTPPRITTNAATSARVGQAYHYSVGATDADGDPLTFSLDPASVTAGLTIHPTNGLVTWQTPVQGTNAVTVTVSDGRGGTANQTFALVVGPAATSYTYPWIEDITPRFAAVGLPYAGVVQASDADGDTLTFELDSASITAGLEIQSTGAQTASLTWASPSGSARQVRVIVRDPSGRASYMDFTLGVRTNAAPTIFSEAPAVVSAGATYVYPVLAEDPDLSDTLTYRLADAPAGMTIDASGRIRWQTTSSTTSPASVTVIVEDPFGATDEQEFDIVVQPDATGPLVQVYFDQNPVNPDTPVRVRLVAVDDVALASSSLSVGGQLIALDSEGYGAYTSPGTPGNVTFVAVATDEAGNVTTENFTLGVRDESDTIKPTAVISSPVADDVVTDRADIVATLADNVGITRYVIEAGLANGGAFQVIKEQEYSTPQSSVSGALAEFDATGLKNGLYTIRITAEDAGGNIAVAERQVSVESELKLANYRLSEVDLTINLAGVPIELTREYDSLNRAEFSDFGYGWTLGYDLDLAEGSEIRETYAVDINDLNYRPNRFVSVRAGPSPSAIDDAQGLNPSRDVYLTLPDGRRVKFTYREVGVGGNEAQAIFESPEGVSARLEILGNNRLRRSGNEAFAGPWYWVANGGLTAADTGLFGIGSGDPRDKYDIPGYVLTLDDGTKITLNKSERPETLSRGDDGIMYDIDGEPTWGGYSYVKHTYYNDPTVTKIEDAQGNRLDFTSGGIVHSSGKGLMFQRDELGRIKTVTDSDNDVVLEYTYNGQGDLVAVVRLEEKASEGIDARKATTRYSYVGRNGASTHLIEKVTSPSGKVPSINEYDDEGRLVATIDGFGNRVEYPVADRHARQQVVRDRLGQETVTVYDASGNVLQVTNPAGETTRYTYDANNNVLTETTAFGTAHAFTKTYTYDAMNFRESENYAIRAFINGQWVDRTVTTLMKYIDVETGEHVLDYMISADGTKLDNTYYSSNDQPQWAGLLKSNERFGTDGITLLEKTSFEYDNWGNVTKEIKFNKDATGQWLPYVQTVNLYATDGSGWLLETRTEKPSGSPSLLRKTTFEHDTNGNPRFTREWKRDAGGNWEAYAVTEQRYDVAGRKVEEIDPIGRSTKTVYNADGQPFQQIDYRGVITETRYDAIGQAGEQVVAAETSEATSTFTRYNSDGRVRESEDAFGNITRFFNDKIGRVVKTEYPDGTSAEKVYDSAGRIEYQTDRHAADVLARGTRNVYSPAGQILRVVKLDGLEIGVATIGEISSSSVIDPGDAYAVTETFYDASNRVVGISGSDGQLTSTVFDPITGRVKSQLQPEVTVYDPIGGQDIRVRPQTDYEYDGLGRQVVTVAPQTWMKNAAGQVTSVKPRTQTQYNEVDEILRTTFHDGSFTTAEYDDLGRLVEQTEQVRAGQPAGPATTFAYDEVGNVTDVWQPAVQTVVNGTTYTRQPHYQYEYNSFGEQTVQRDAQDDDVTDLPNAQDRETKFLYDFRGRRTERVLPGDVAGEGEAWTYDRYGRVLTHTDFKRRASGQGQVTYYVYDDAPRDAGDPADAGKIAGRLQKKLFFSTPAAYETYVSNPVLPANLPVREVEYTYDARGRLEDVIERVRQDASTPSMTQVHKTTTLYDIENRVVEVQNDLEGSIHYEYEDMTGRLVRTWSANTDTAYGYDEHGVIDSVYVAKLNGTTYAAYSGYNSTTRQPAFSSGTPLETKYIYDASGSLDRVVYPNAVTHDFDYDALKRVESISVTRGAMPIESYDYDVSSDNGLRTGVLETSYDGSGGLLAVRELDYVYDDLNRLVQERLDADNDGTGTGDVTTDYNLDLVGNRLTKTIDTGSDGTADEVVKSTYNAKDHLLAEDSTINANDATFTYDDNGSLTGTVRNGVATRQLWDVRNKLVGIDVNGDGDSSDSGEASYAYDDAGNRIAITKDSVTRRFLVNPSNPTGYSQVLEELESGVVKVSYVLGRDVIAQDATTADADPQYLVYDAHGSTRRLLDATGQPATGQIYAYDAFGSAIDTKLASGTTLDFDPGTALTRLLYTGEWFDAPSGQYFLRARYYDASTGRFGSYDFGHEGDVNDPQSLNKFAYSEGDPVNGIDPSGNVTISEQLAVAKQRLKMLSRGFKAVKRVTPIVLKTLVPLSMAANYQTALASAMARRDRILENALKLSQPYNALLVASFLRIPNRKLILLERLDDIRDILTGVSSARVRALAKGYPADAIGGTGFPDFGTVRNALHNTAHSLFMPLTGSISRDRTRANTVRGFVGLGARPDRRFVWHHHEVPGVMQYVRRVHHSAIGHNGGRFYYTILKNIKEYGA